MDVAASKEDSRAQTNLVGRGAIPRDREGLYPAIFGGKEQVGARPINKIQEGAAVASQGSTKITLRDGGQKVAEVSGKSVVLAKSAIPLKFLGLPKLQLRPAACGIQTMYLRGWIGEGAIEQSAPANSSS